MRQSGGRVTTRETRPRPADGLGNRKMAAEGSGFQAPRSPVGSGFNAGEGRRMKAGGSTGREIWSLA